MCSGSGGGALTVRDQYSCRGPGDCTDCQGPALCVGSGHPLNFIISPNQDYPHLPISHTDLGWGEEGGGWRGGGGVEGVQGTETMQQIMIKFMGRQQQQNKKVHDC